MELPRALMPWSAFLDLFPREIAAALGPLVRRLDAAVGPLRASSRPGTGEPDGFDGLTRRGNYERLLLSEWLLAEEVPEEFARRAVMSEHAFLQMARREPKGGLTATALFDAGPNQIGAPRIAQMAALIVLARRAESAGAKFQWGILQQSIESLRTDVTAATLARLLDARATKEASEEDVTRWREAITSTKGAADSWLIGSPRLANFPAAAGMAHLALTDPFDPDLREIHVAIRDGGRIRPAIVLPLPAEADCARLLRDPFRIVAPVPRRIPGEGSKITALAFSSDGAKLFARRDEETLLVWTVPASPRADAGNPKQYCARPFAPIVAAGKAGKGFALVTQGEAPDVLQIHRVGSQKGKFSVLPFTIPLDLPAPAGDDNPPPPRYRRSFDEQGKTSVFAADENLPPCFLLPAAPESQRWLIRAGGMLLRPHIDENKPEVRQASMVMGKVKAWGEHANGWAFVGRGHDAAGAWSLRVFAPDGTMRVTHLFQSVYSAFCGFHQQIAVEETPGTWRLCAAARENDIYLKPPALASVVGVTSRFAKHLTAAAVEEPCLLLLNAEGREISFFGKSGIHLLLTAPAPIAQVLVSPARAVIACRFETGEITVYSTIDGSILMQAQS